MAYRQSLMKYAEKYGVSRASRKYNKSRSYIYFWKQRWDGSVASLACQSRRPHGRPSQHTEAELKLIRDMRRRNSTLGMIELWHRLCKHFTAFRFKQIQLMQVGKSVVEKLSRRIHILQRTESEIKLLNQRKFSRLR